MMFRSNNVPFQQPVSHSRTRPRRTIHFSSVGDNEILVQVKKTGRPFVIFTIPRLTRFGLGICGSDVCFPFTAPDRNLTAEHLRFISINAVESALLLSSNPWYFIFHIVKKTLPNRSTHFRFLVMSLPDWFLKVDYFGLYRAECHLKLRMKSAQR